MNTTAKNPLRPGLALLILFVGHLCATLFMSNLGLGLDAIEDPVAGKWARTIHAAFRFGSTYFGPPLALFILFLAFRIWRGKPVQAAIDFIGGFLTLRCLIIFVVLNLLLLSQLKAGGVLLIQLVLFLPVITLNFGWLYWRLDTAARAKGRQHIRFSEDDGSPDPFDYFYMAAMQLTQFEPAVAGGASRLMKTLFVVHGIMMLDLVALTLSRAIGLASGGG